MNGKTPSESYTEQVHLVQQSELNGYGRLFGGVLLSWIDVLAGIVARRHTHSNVTTAAMDDMSFLGPAYANDLVVLCGTVTFTGRTSLEVCVKSYVEHMDGTRSLINVAYVVMVALDETERPVEVPPILPQTQEEIDAQAAGEKRRIHRVKHMKKM